MKNILAISGSIKQNSSNNRILAFIADALKAEANVEIYDGLQSLPFFGPGLYDDQQPAVVKSFLANIAAADAVLITTPEYVFSIPGILKNALEWTVASTVFSDKPVAIITAASSGEKALAELDLIMATLAQQSIPAQRKLLIQAPGRYFDNKGNLIDKEIKEKALAVVRDLAKL